MKAKDLLDVGIQKIRALPLVHHLEIGPAGFAGQDPLVFVRMLVKEVEKFGIGLPAGGTSGHQGRLPVKGTEKTVVPSPVVRDRLSDHRWRAANGTVGILPFKAFEKGDQGFVETLEGDAQGHFQQIDKKGPWHIHPFGDGIEITVFPGQKICNHLPFLPAAVPHVNRNPGGILLTLPSALLHDCHEPPELLSGLGEGEAGKGRPVNQRNPAGETLPERRIPKVDKGQEVIRPGGVPYLLDFFIKLKNVPKVWPRPDMFG